MFGFLKRLWQWLKRWFGRRDEPTPPPVPPAPDNTEYENVLMAVLEGVDGGYTWGNLQGLLMSRRVEPDGLAAWLASFGERWLEHPQSYQERAGQLIRLGQVAPGELGRVAGELGERLQGDSRVSDEGIGESSLPENTPEVSEAGASQDGSYEDLIEQGINDGRRGDYSSALAYFDKAIKLKPDQHEAWGNRGVALLNLGRLEEAIASYDKAIELKPDDHLSWSNRGNALSALGRLEEALASYDKAIEFKPDDHDAWNGRGVVLSNLGRLEEAIASYDKAIEFKPDDHYAWNNRGNALSNLGRLEEAIASYEKALEFKPDNHGAWNGRGVVLSNLGRLEEAIASYDKAIEFKPDLHYAWGNRGNALKNLGKLEEAIASYDKAIEFKPDDHKAWGNRGFAALNSRGYQEFFHLANSVIHNNPELKQRGYEGKLASLRAELDKAIRRDTHPEGWGFLHHQIGRAQYFQGQRNAKSGLGSAWGFYRQAEDSYKTALLTLQPPQFSELHLEVLRDLARVLLQLEETVEAEEILRQGSDLLRRMLAEETRPERNKKQLARKFSDFDQLTVDLIVQSGDLTAALLLAERGKTVCLRWLLGIDEPPEVNYAQIQTLVDAQTAAIYWHLSPNSLTTFLILPDSPSPDNPTHHQLFDWENWLSLWNQNYDSYSQGKKSADEPPVQKKNHFWRKQISSQLDRLKNILNIPELERQLHEKQIKNLILIPHRDLHRFPLHALFEDFTCQFLPCATFGLNRQLPQPPLSKLLLVKNPPAAPTFRGKKKSLDPLPYAEVEATLLQQMYPDHRCLDRKNSPQNRDAIQAALRENYHIFHFSGHGAYNSSDPAQSCLFLSGTEQLTLPDIIELDLGSYGLICLAACETAVTGDRTITDEYVGLASAFLKAGARHVVSTLWTVESAATMLFMKRFYTALQTREPVAALKAAQTDIRTATREDLMTWLEDIQNQLTENPILCNKLENERRRISEMSDSHPYDHPYYWAAFTIFGR